MEETVTAQEELRRRLLEEREGGYRKFSAGLLPGTENILGIRLPKLRVLAKEIAKGDWRSFLQNAYGDYFEEIMIQGMVIGCAKMEPEERLDYIARFIPKIDNWSVCDCFCAGLKFTAKHLNRVWEFLQPYLHSEQEFEARFAAVMLLDYFVVPEYIGRALEALGQIRHEGYYVKMAAAWALSVCYVKFPRETDVFLQNCTLDDWTYNKTLQKICESHRVSAETKTQLRARKRPVKPGKRKEECPLYR